MKVRNFGRKVISQIFFFCVFQTGRIKRLSRQHTFGAMSVSHTRKTVWETEKTTSYVGKITSDIIKTASDLFLRIANI